MTTPTPTPTPEPRTPSATLLRLMWLASPALPVGGFSYSEGLEAAVDQGLVKDQASATRWLADQLVLVLARAEMPLLHRALRAWNDDDPLAVRDCNDWVLQTRETRELRLQTEQMGRSLAQWLQQRLATDDPRTARLLALPGGPTWPVAFALACAHAAATEREALLALGFGWAENQVQAAIKCVPLGQSAGQTVLARLVTELDAAVDEALSRDGQAIAFSPGLALLSARHEDQYSRLFRS